MIFVFSVTFWWQKTNPTTACAVPLPLGKGGLKKPALQTKICYRYHVVKGLPLPKIRRERFAVTKIKDFDSFSLGVVTQIGDLDNTPMTYVSFRQHKCLHNALSVTINTKSEKRYIPCAVTQR